MKVIVRLGNGKYYLSKVFGIFKNNIMGSKAKYYYIIFDENMKTLIPKFEYKQNTDYIIPEILIYDNDTSDMKINGNHCGQVNFLSDDEMKNILDGKVNDTILEKCMKYVDNNKIDYIEIKNDKDIKNFMLVSGYLHDGYIKKIFKNKNQLFITFDGLWGCKIEIVFEGNIQYQNQREENDLWWCSSSMVFDANEIILTDDEEYQKGDDLQQVQTWFKAEKVKYKVIPN